MTSTVADMQADLKTSKENYKLRPLILLITEEDGSPYEWFIRNQDKLYELGYRTINIEQCLDKSINSLLKNEPHLQAKHDKFMNGTYNSEAQVSDAYFFNKMDNYQHNQALFSVLKRLKTDDKFKRWRYNLIDVNSTLIELACLSARGVDSIRGQRDQNFAANISESCNKAKGGVVTILGNSHYVVYGILKDRNPLFANSALFIDMSRFVPFVYNKPSTNFSIEEINDARKASYARNRNKFKETCKSYFPAGCFMAVDYSDDRSTAVLDQVILKKAQILLEPQKQTTPVANSANSANAENVSSETTGATASLSASPAGDLKEVDLKANSETMAFSSAMKAISPKTAGSSAAGVEVAKAQAVKAEAVEAQAVEAEAETPAPGAKKKKKKKKNK